MGKFIWSQRKHVNNAYAVSEIIPIESVLPTEVIPVGTINYPNTFTFENNEYIYTPDSNDASVYGCIREIVLNNEYRLDLFKNRVGKYFIDIGANCGIASIILAKQNPNSTILAYEPNPQCFQLLKSNVEINKLKNIKIFNMGVSDNITKNLLLTITPGFSGGGTTYAKQGEFKQAYNVSGPDVLAVECTSLDNIVKDSNISEIELLKIDCEGAEYSIIYNSEYFKQKIVKNIVGEFHSLNYTDVDNDIEKLLMYCKIYVSGLLKITKLYL